MFRQFAFATTLVLFSTSHADAHSEGHGAIQPEQAIFSAISGTDYFTREPVDRDWSPLDKSWAQLPASAAKILANVDGDYVVAVTNPQDGRIFYVLVAYSGAIIDANFTGTFPYVWDAQDPDSQTTD